MRKKVFFALGCVLYLTGCDSSSLEKVIPQTKFFPIQFSIQMEKEIVSFPTRSIPNNVIPEPTVSKAGESDAELNEICSTIEYVVFKNEDTPALIKHKQFTYDPTDLDAFTRSTYTAYLTSSSLTIPPIWMRISVAYMIVCHKATTNSTF